MLILQVKEDLGWLSVAIHVIGVLSLYQPQICFTNIATIKCQHFQLLESYIVVVNIGILA